MRRGQRNDSGGSYAMSSIACKFIERDRIRLGRYILP